MQLAPVAMIVCSAAQLARLAEWGGTPNLLRVWIGVSLVPRVGRLAVVGIRECAFGMQRQFLRLSVAPNDCEKDAFGHFKRNFCTWTALLSHCELKWLLVVVINLSSTAYFHQHHRHRVFLSLFPPNLINVLLCFLSVICFIPFDLTDLCRCVKALIRPSLLS